MGASGLTELVEAVSGISSSDKSQLNSKTYVEDDVRMDLIMQYQAQATETAEYKELEWLMREASERSTAYWKAVDAEAMRMFKEHGADLFPDLDEVQQQRTANAVYRRRAQESIGPVPTGAAQARHAMEAFVRVFVGERMPERNPHADSARQRRDQQSLDAFKHWHEGSKVVDREGNPIIAFHATCEIFDAFRCGDDQALRKSSRNPDYSGALGTWFAAPPLYDLNYDEGAAEDTVEGFVIGRDGIREYRHGANVMPVYLAIKNPKEFGDYEDFQDERDSYESQWDFKQAMVAAGHDGFVIRNCDTDGNNDRDDWVAFHPHQIKSAIGNSGAFDPDSPSLTDSAPAPGKAAAPPAKSIDDSEAFKRWCGRSKLVLPTGEPLRAFHGTNKDLDVFRLGGKAQAIFVTVDPVYASMVAETKGWGNGDNVLPVYVRAENPMFVSESEYSFDAIAQAKAGGCDALVTMADDGSFGRTIAVFSPHQVKSAIGNSGAFDPESASLTDRAKLPAKALTRVEALMANEGFMNWFGPSKVRHAETGHPLMVYHGTGREIEEFDVGRDGSCQTNGNRTGAWGSYFTPSAKEASIYAEMSGGSQNIVPVYLSIANPYVMGRTEWMKHSNTSAKMDTREQGREYALQVRDEIKAQGFDGIVIRGRGFNDEWIAFEPTQIKSAIGNSGAFDPDSPSLTDRKPSPELEPDEYSMEPF